MAFHEYEGVALDLDERGRLQRDLGDKNLMLLRNHGTLALGRTVPEAFARMYWLEWACTTQVRTLGMGRTIHLPPDAAIAKVAAQTSPEMMDKFSNQLLWPALLRKMDRLDPSYRD
jgi:ribulose-5-phosphate 4-epimerase/fuculose-1-phosphate aldolase